MQAVKVISPVRSNRKQDCSTSEITNPVTCIPVAIVASCPKMPPPSADASPTLVNMSLRGTRCVGLTDQYLG